MMGICFEYVFPGLDFIPHYDEKFCCMFSFVFEISGFFSAGEWGGGWCEERNLISSNTHPYTSRKEEKECEKTKHESPQEITEQKHREIVFVVDDSSSVSFCHHFSFIC